jgi:uncharacterized protein YkwD
MKAILSKIVFLLLVPVSIFASSPAPKYSPAKITKFDINSIYFYSSEETELMDMINIVRESNGLNKLEHIDYISHKSEEHNGYMISINEITHNLFKDRATDIINVLGAKTVGENLAFRYKTANGALTGWLNSEVHKKNILGDFTHFGISIRTNPDGKKYYTNIFIKK